MKQLPKAMKVIPEPAPKSRSVMILGYPKGPLIKSNGPLSYDCGNCGRTIYRNIHFKQVQNVVVKCGCGAFNEVSASNHGH